MSIRSLFCRHIWQREKETFLRSYKTVVFDLVVIGHYEVYAVEEKCMKCGKERLHEVTVRTDLK